MGLTISHDCWEGAYSAFNRWRIELARAAGLPPLDLMEGHFARGDFTDPFLERERLFPGCMDSYYESLPIRWDSLKPSPLHDLLNHSDCEGKIPWKNCGAIAASLEALLPHIKEGDGGGHIGVWREKTQQFINGLRRAHEAKMDVEFY